MSLVWKGDFAGLPGKVVLAKDYIHGPADPDVAAYIAAVETADGQGLEEEVKVAYSDFVIGCKADGIWDAIKASCILAGARTLDGALVPLKGSAPTNNGPFTTSDYNRKTGLLGNGSTKYLNTKRANNAEPQNSKHASAYITEKDSSKGYVLASDVLTTTGATVIYPQPAFPRVIVRANCGGFGGVVNSLTSDNSLVAVDRSASNGFFFRHNQTSSFVTYTSQTPSSSDILIFARPGPLDVSSDRIAFYSIGETLPNNATNTGLELLDARTSTLISDLGAAIP